MLFTTKDPIPPPQVLDLVHAVQAIDRFAQVRIDATGRQARIDGRLTPQQATAAIRTAGLAGVVTDAPHERGGSTCCGSCG